jgi:hypothetical protein
MAYDEHKGHVGIPAGIDQTITACVVAVLQDRNAEDFVELVGDTSRLPMLFLRAVQVIAATQTVLAESKGIPEDESDEYVLSIYQHQLLHYAASPDGTYVPNIEEPNKPEGEENGS